MLVAQHPVRLRSNSSPARPRASRPPEASTSAVQAPNPTPTVQTKTPPERPRNKKASFSNVFPNTTFPSPSNTFRVLSRLKRPATSSGTPTPQHTFPTSEHASQESLPSPKASRRRGLRRPSTASGVPERAHPPLRLQAMTATVFDVPRRRESSPFRPAFPPIHVNKSSADASSDMNPSYRGGKDKARPHVVIPKGAEEVQGVSSPVAEKKPAVEEKSRMPPKGKFKLKNNKKHHAYSAKEVPYPVNYERQVIDNDIWEHMWVKQSCGNSLTWHRLDQPPLKALDLGCGSGHWILECAAQWKTTQFVGLDIVPLHPDLYALGSNQMASRITWIQANFLERLPFADAEFDFIHCKRIARGVPEDKWDGLLEEIHRILKPGGVFELFEEELFFPGKPLHTAEPEPMNLPGSLPSPSSDLPHTDGFSSSDSLTPSSGSGSSKPPSIQPPQPERLLPRRTLSGSMVNLGVTFANAGPIPPPTRTKSPLNPVRSLPPVPTIQEHSSPSIEFEYAKDKVTKPPIDPRDHSLLEFIYNEMHASRFVNLEPLALLKNSLPLFFKDVCLHPALILTFPPRAEPRAPLADSQVRTPTQNNIDGDAAQPLPSDSSPIVSLVSLLAGTNPYVMVDDERVRAHYQKGNAEALQRVLHGTLADPIPDSLDEHAQAVKVAHSNRCHRPIDSIQFDLRSLNLHLSMRVQEVLGCAEEMWAWVTAYQNKVSPQTPFHPPGTGSFMLRFPLGQSAPPSPASVRQPHHAVLSTMGRADFDEMMSRFELDMQERLGLGGVVQGSLGWTRGQTSRTQARKDFEQMCAEWAIHQRTQAASILAPRLQAPSAPDMTPKIDVLSLDDYVSESLFTDESTPGKTSGSKPSRGSRGSKEDPSPSASSLQPWERVSRKIFAYVAWKS